MMQHTNPYKWNWPYLGEVSYGNQVILRKKMAILLARSQRNRTVAGIWKKDATEARSVERIDLD